MSKYIPSPSKWVSDQVEIYESSGGIEGTTMNGLPVIIVTNRGWKTDSIRKTPLMKVMDGKKYILVASNGGASNHPSWYKNIKKEPKVQIQDGPTIYHMKANEVTDTITKNRLWEIMEKAFPPYRDYKNNTTRDIPVFLAE